MAAPHPVDVHVGGRLRQRRSVLGMSQDELGTSVGVTFQQIQKYERGVNRIGSGRLFDFARILNVPVSYFFEELNKKASEVGFAEGDNDSVDSGTLSSKETLSLVRAYYRISDPNVRKKVLSLIKALSTNDKE